MQDATEEIDGSCNFKVSQTSAVTLKVLITFTRWISLTVNLTIKQFWESVHVRPSYDHKSKMLLFLGHSINAPLHARTLPQDVASTWHLYVWHMPTDVEAIVIASQIAFLSLNQVNEPGLISGQRIGLHFVRPSQRWLTNVSLEPAEDVLSRIWDYLVCLKVSSQHINWTELKLTDLNKSTQLHDAFIGHPRTDWLQPAKLGQSVFVEFSTHVKGGTKKLSCWFKRICQ